MTDREALQRGCDAFARQDWGRAHRELSAADDGGALAAEDLERLATAAYLVGEESQSEDTWARAHQAFLDRGDHPAAVRSAFWLGFGLISRGEVARGSGWLARAGRLCEEHDLDCAERGYLLVVAGITKLEQEGDAETAFALLEEAGSLAERFADPDVTALSRLGRGQALIRLGRSREGVSLLDEVMVQVTTGEVSPRVAGIVYCAVVDECQRMFDVRRAHEWTEALTRWCDAQSGLVPYRGQCLVHRSQLMQMHGNWRDALVEAERAQQRLAEPPHPAIGMAHYQLGELHRLRGSFDEAERAYRQANASGHTPHPGLALVWLARGRVDHAAAAIRSALEQAPDQHGRLQLLAAAVEILLAGDHAEEAQAAVDELTTIAGEIGTPLLGAVTARCQGAVRLAAGDAQAALPALRVARDVWRELDAPYELARTRVLLGRTHRALGDAATAELEWDAARQTFQNLEAVPELNRLDELAGVASNRDTGLTSREVEVLRLVAAGRTNQQIADELVISPRTVERHLTNTYTKLGISNRAAATAYAYEKGLV